MLELNKNGLPYAWKSNDEYGDCSEFYYKDGFPYRRDWQDGMGDWSDWYECGWDEIALILAEAMKEEKRC